MTSGVFRCYREKEFSKAHLELIGWVNDILDDLAKDGLDATLRQIHYQLTNRPDYENTKSNYDRLGNVVSEARMAGLISWTAIEDRERHIRGHAYNDYPEEVFRGLDVGYRRNKWNDQDFYPVVGIEKRALEGVIANICYDLEVPFVALKGYSSQSVTWRLGQKLARAIQRGQRPIFFHLGDLDPSGWDMTRDLRERLSLFAGTPITVQRLALNMPQVEEYKPQPNFAKEKDSRNASFYAEFGILKAYELDALSPRIIQGLIRDAVTMIRDDAKWADSIAKEAEDKEYIIELVERLGLDIPEEEDLYD